MTPWIRLATTAVLGAVLLAPAAWSATGGDEATEAAAVVTAFNAAVTGRDLEKAASYFAPGSVQFTLRPSHPGTGGAPADSLTSALRSHWMMVGSVLISATKVYSRKAEILDSRAEGDIATVWTRVTTVTERSDKAEKKTDSFVEVYLMVRKDDRWMIGAMVDNRRPNDVGIGNP